LVCLHWGLQNSEYTSVIYMINYFFSSDHPTHLVQPITWSLFASARLEIALDLVNHVFSTYR
jgi:hypothetical protein